MTSVIRTTVKQVTRPTVVATLGTACALTVAIGLLMWQDGQLGGEPAAVVRAAGQEARLVAAAHHGYRPDVDIAADGPLGSTMPAADQAGGAPTIIIVATADAAAAVPVTSNTAVVVVRSATDEHRLVMTIAHADATNAERGLPALTVVDQRGG
jgi:hypothetical protein